MEFKVKVELQHVSGPEQDVDTMLDFFAGTIGQQNGAKNPVKLTVPDEHGGPEFGGVESVYIVRLIDDV
jgi:hypothetical protein